MSVRIIKYTVSENGISPASIQLGGIQGEHNATRLDFTVNDDLQAKLSTAAENGRLLYRFDGYDGAGGVASTEPVEFLANEISYSLENWLTRFGGKITVYLVFSVCDSDTYETQMELYSFPVVLSIKDKPAGEEIEGEAYDSVPMLAHIAKISAERATVAAEISTEALEKTKNAKAALEGDVVWVFDGGDSAGPSLPLKVVVDKELSETSANPLQNRVVTAAINELRNALVDMMYPVGSVYISFSELSPADIYGGIWERVKDTFLIAAGDEYVAGSVGGEAMHTLTVDEMPRHAHHIYKGEGSSAAYRFTPAGTGVDAQNFADTAYEGSNSAHNNMPPYIAVYMWRRVS